MPTQLKRTTLNEAVSRGILGAGVLWQRNERQLEDRLRPLLLQALRDTIDRRR